ncbi:hypothetical protein IE53DRAFT_388800 [Violaceomyces palustris]|uniref:Uncharacterized protein n=1 Tax=Violaceomyces palustris TaxID=1673888 RepID=A0ACD0NT51_9BASI|nr:hypothetical protein IE53DRAFT_388800 [Violaceomyces palustris]
MTPSPPSDPRFKIPSYSDQHPSDSSYRQQDNSNSTDHQESLDPSTHSTTSSSRIVASKADHYKVETTTLTFSSHSSPSPSSSSSSSDHASRSINQEWLPRSSVSSHLIQTWRSERPLRRAAKLAASSIRSITTPHLHQQHPSVASPKRRKLSDEDSSSESEIDEGDRTGSSRLDRFQRSSHGGGGQSGMEPYVEIEVRERSHPLKRPRPVSSSPEPALHHPSRRPGSGSHLVEEQLVQFTDPNSSSTNPSPLYVPDSDPQSVPILSSNDPRGTSLVPLPTISTSAFQPFLEQDTGLPIESEGRPLKKKKDADEEEGVEDRRQVPNASLSDRSKQVATSPPNHDEHHHHQDNFASSPVDEFSPSQTGSSSPQTPSGRTEGVPRVGTWMVPSPPPRDEPVRSSSSFDDILIHTPSDPPHRANNPPGPTIEPTSSASAFENQLTKVLDSQPSVLQGVEQVQGGGERDEHAGSTPRESTPSRKERKQGGGVGSPGRDSERVFTNPPPSQSIASMPAWSPPSRGGVEGEGNPASPPEQPHLSDHRHASNRPTTQQSLPASSLISLISTARSEQGGGGGEGGLLPLPPHSQLARKHIVGLVQTSDYIPDLLKQEVEQYVMRAKRAPAASQVSDGGGIGGSGGGERSFRSPLPAEKSAPQSSQDNSETQEDGHLRTKPTWVFELERSTSGSGGQQKPTRSLILLVMTEEGWFDVQEVDDHLLEPLRSDVRYSAWFDCEGRRFPPFRSRKVVGGAEPSLGEEEQEAASLGGSQEDQGETRTIPALRSEIQKLKRELEDERRLRSEMEARHVKEKERLNVAKKSAEEEYEFMRNLYSQASTSAANSADEARVNLERAEKLERQLKEGLALQSNLGKEARKRVEMENSRLKGQIKLLTSQNRRTDDGVRRKAAEWEALEAREREIDKARKRREQVRLEEEEMRRRRLIEMDKEHEERRAASDGAGENVDQEVGVQAGKDDSGGSFEKEALVNRGRKEERQRSEEPLDELAALAQEAAAAGDCPEPLLDQDGNPGSEGRRSTRSSRRREEASLHTGQADPIRPRTTLPSPSPPPLASPPREADEAADEKDGQTADVARRNQEAPLETDEAAASPEGTPYFVGSELGERIGGERVITAVGGRQAVGRGWQETQEERSRRKARQLEAANLSSLMAADRAREEVEHQFEAILSSGTSNNLSQVEQGMEIESMIQTAEDEGSNMMMVSTFEGEWLSSPSP